MRLRLHQNSAIAFWGALLGAWLLTGCVTKDVLSRAVLTNVDDATISTLKAALSKATHKAQIEFGAGGIRDTSTITVLPSKLGPLEIHSTKVPVVFDLFKREAECVIVRRETGQEYPLPGVTCRAE